MVAASGGRSRRQKEPSEDGAAKVQAANSKEAPAGELSERQRLALEQVVGLTKQLIVLNTGLIALGLTFFKDIASPDPGLAGIVLAGSWVVLLLSAMFGVATLMAVVGQISKSDDPSPYATSLRVWGQGQISLFFLGLMLTIGAGICSSL